LPGGGPLLAAGSAATDNTRFLLAGTGSTGDNSRNRAIWQTVSSDLRIVEPVQSDNTNVSGVLDAAMSKDSRLLAVGRLTDNDNRNVGWVGFIGGTVSNVAADSHRRAPNKGLERLTSLPLAGGAFRLPATSFPTGVGFYDEDLGSGAQRDLSMSLTTTRTIRISAHTDGGDLDLVVCDASKRPVAFSNFKKSATELIIATLAPGDYTVSIVAHTPIRAYDVRFGLFQEISAKILSTLTKLPEDQRIELTDLLTLAGYTRPGELSIALGSESVRALLAAQEGAQGSFGVGGIGKTVTQAMGDR